MKYFQLKLVLSQVAKIDGQKGHKKNFLHILVCTKNEKNLFPNPMWKQYGGGG